MILKKITIQNIASIEHAEVDFTQSPLNTADLFLIHGETGSGKTTIIDAICLALFNNTPRLKTAPANVLSFGAYNLSSRDTANMLRHGAKDALAELLFIGNDHKEYTAQWSAHATPSTINTNHILLQDGNQIAKGMQVAPMMRDSILGMTFDDFCRTAVLAQGEFTRFLKCSDDEKAAILEKLTATEEFSEVGKTIYAMWKEKSDDYAFLRQQMEGIQLLSAEEIQAINDAISQAQEELSAIDSKIGTLTAQKNWIVQKASIQAQRDKTLKEYQEVVILCQDPDYLVESKLLADYDLSQQAIADLRALRDNESKSQQADEQERQLALQFSQAAAGLAYLHQQLATQKKDLEDLSSMIDAQQPHKEMFDKSAAVLAHLQLAGKKTANHATETAKVKDLEEKKIPDCKRALSDAQEAQKKVQEEHNVKLDEIKKKQQDIQSLDGDAIKNRNQQLNEMRDRLNQASLSLKSLHTAIEKVEETEGKISMLQKELEDMSPRLERLRTAKEEAQKAYNQAEEAYRSIDLASKEWAVAARSILHEGDVCPVCGNVYSTAKFNEVVISVKDAQETKLNQAKEAKSRSEKAYNEFAAALAQKNRDLKELQEQHLPSVQKALQSVFQETSADCQLVQIPIPDATRASYQEACALGTQKRKELSELLDENNKKLGTLNVYNAQLAELNTQLDQLNTKRTIAAQTVNDAQKALEKCQGDIATAKDNVEKYAKEAADAVANATAIITWPNWKAEWEAAPAAFMQSLKEAAHDYRQALERHAQLKPQITQLETQLNTYDNQRDALVQTCPHWTAFPVDAQFSDRQTDRWNILTRGTAAVHQQKTTALGEIEKAQKALQLFYADHPAIDQERLTRLMVFPAAVVRQKHENQNRRLNELKGAVDTNSKNLENHLEAKPADLDPDKDAAVLTKEMEDLTKQKDTLSQAVGANNQKLAADKDNQKVYGKKQVELDARKVILDKWTLFNDKYGDTNGKKFRRLAQQLIFDRLLQLANQHLARLTARYSLQTIPGTLTISLCDQYTPGYGSSVHNLSGGESFMVSLSLALALSSMGRAGISMDTLFIDEGFGTLSTDNQIRVMDLLQTLQRTQGKRVGIISHVPYLLERIPVQIKVARHPSDNTKSSVQIFTSTT